MNSSTTRISDLPDNNNPHFNNQSTASTSYSNQPIHSNKTNELTGDINTNYTPINIHPNPYGISEKNPIMPNPEFTEPSVNNKPSINLESMQNMPQQQLPSRDIPADTNVYTQDPQVNPNFMPPSDKDYFLEDFDKYEKGFKIEEKKEIKKDMFDTIMSHIQVPVLLAILFYIFNTGTIKILLLCYIPYKYIYDTDANLNNKGYLLLSIMFGITYYIIDFFIHYISNM